MKNLEKYQSFVFEDYQFERETGELKLRYSFDEKVHFEEVLKFPLEGIDWSRVNLQALKQALDNLHLIMGISYYKAYCPKRMVLKEQVLSPEQGVFWKRLYERGLGEFFYRNEIDFRDLVNFPVDESAEVGHVHLDLSDRALVPIGGGKDSLVTAELLDDAGEDFTYFSLRDEKPIRDTAAVLGKDRLIIGRQLDLKLLQLNEEGAFNGHVPITAVISFLLVVCAVLYDYRSLVMSLEKSADFGQIVFHEMDINHQYSKSYEFEQDFSAYVKRFISPDIDYFSFLRPLYELSIGKIFAGTKNFDNYAPVFASCNANFKLLKDGEGKKWCGQCPKCAFVYSILAPYVQKKQLMEIFGQNLLANAELTDLYLELFGVKDIKPFECVGTPEEMIAAFLLIRENGEYQDDVMMKIFEEQILPQLATPEKIVEEALRIEETTTMPEKYREILNQALAK